MAPRVQTIRDQELAGRDLQDIFFEGLESLAPHDLEGRALTAWLSAPIAGDPLFRRLFEPLLQLSIQSCYAAPGRVANALRELTEQRPPFGHRLNLDSGIPAMLSDISMWASHGVIEDLKTSASNCARLRVDDYESLMQVASMALEGDLEGRLAKGEFHGDCLVGERARYHPSVSMLGVSALGADSCLAAHVTMGHHAIVGERCHVGANSNLENCLVLDGSWIPPGTHLRDGLWTAQKGQAAS